MSCSTAVANLKTVNKNQYNLEVSLHRRSCRQNLESSLRLGQMSELLKALRQRPAKEKASEGNES